MPTVQYCDYAKRVLHRSQRSVWQWHFLDAPLQKIKKTTDVLEEVIKQTKSANPLKLFQVLFIKGTKLWSVQCRHVICSLKKTVLAHSQVKMWLSFEKKQGTVRPSHTAGDRVWAPLLSLPWTTAHQSSVERNVPRNSPWQDSDHGLRDHTSIRPTTKLRRDGRKIPSLPLHLWDHAPSSSLPFPSI